MSFFSTIRERRSRRTRGALGVLIGLWLNFALAQRTEVTEGLEGAELTLGQTCAAHHFDDFKHDGRNVQLKLKDIPGDLPLVLPPPLEQRWSAQAAAHVACGPGRSPPPGHQIPLNILYCVYLD